jgi:uncharacterized protein YndB with AHSA1/START domain
MSEKTRSFETAVEVDASPEEVWRALAEASELVRWFPLAARVVPGAGGETEWAWRDAFRWRHRIEAWEPGRRLRLVDDAARPFDLDGQPLAPGAAPPAPVAIEFTLERDGAQTVVRLVHSGFGAGAAWDDELDAVSWGWRFQLRSLAHYLARHRGRERAAAWRPVSTRLDHAGIWRRLAAAGLAIEPAWPAPGERVAIALPTGDRFSGTTLLAAPGRHLSATAEELSDGLVSFESWRAGGETGWMLFASSWEPGAGAALAALEARLGAWAERALAG